MKRKIAVFSLLAVAFSFGGHWMTRRELAEETRPPNSNKAVKTVSAPSARPLLIQPQVTVVSRRQIAVASPVRVSAAWRARAARCEPLLRSASLRYGVDARWLWIIAFLETRFRPDLVSPKGARGLMQFTDATARRYDLANPHDAAASIDAAARYLRDLSMRFGNRFDLVLASYNAGEGAVDAYLKGYALRLPGGRIINPHRLNLDGIPPYAETRNYVASGLALARLFSVPDVPTAPSISPAHRSVFGSANGSSVSASRQALVQPPKPTALAGKLTEQEPVIRSLRVPALTTTSGSQ